MLLVDKMNCTEVRKKRTFDIAFLTGQEDKAEEESSSATRNNDPEDSNSSSIDVLGETTTEVTDVKMRKKEIRFESKREMKLSISNESELRIKENLEFSFPNISINNSSQFNLLKFYQQQQQQHQQPRELRRLPDPFVYYPPMMENTRPHFHPQQNSSSAAAAATLLPPSLTALTLPAQNVCAKCNIGFRMTSDLVYHMRSHHKRDGDPAKKKREDKLKCPVCQENFRERHHLTRHMTAHQDRAEEREEQFHSLAL